MNTFVLTTASIIIAVVAVVAITPSFENGRSDYVQAQLPHSGDADMSRQVAVIGVVAPLQRSNFVQMPRDICWASWGANSLELLREDVPSTVFAVLDAAPAEAPPG